MPENRAQPAASHSRPYWIARRDHAEALRRRGASLVTVDERYYRNNPALREGAALQDFVVPTG